MVTVYVFEQGGASACSLLMDSSSSFMNTTCECQHEATNSARIFHSRSEMCHSLSAGITLISIRSSTVFWNLQSFMWSTEPASSIWPTCSSAPGLSRWSLSHHTFNDCSHRRGAHVGQQCEAWPCHACARGPSPAQHSWKGSGWSLCISHTNHHLTCSINLGLWG